MPSLKIPNGYYYQDIYNNRNEDYLELLETDIDRALLDNDTDKIKELVQTKDLYEN